MTWSDPNATVLIKDLSGRTLIHYNSNTKNINLNLSSLNSGMYLISVNGSTQKLIKVD
ncbi:MAG: T9SS type A sorting domain-containing protein [Saprospiraceae bacterium]|nr:T9SS type A sorting domain-containing protein [Saprospiraceae bacterium]